MKRLLLAALLAAAVLLSACAPQEGQAVEFDGLGCTHPNPEGDEWIGGSEIPRCYHFSTTGMVEKGGSLDAAQYGGWSRVRLQGGAVVWVANSDLTTTP